MREPLDFQVCRLLAAGKSHATIGAVLRVPEDVVREIDEKYTPFDELSHPKAF
jgi:hypothetical protein